MLGISSIDQIEDILVRFLVHQIYLAPVILLILEEVGIPLPFADLVIVYIGYQIAIGRIPYAVGFIILLLSDVIGASILYFVSSKYGIKIVNKFGKYIDLDMDKLNTVEGKFRKFGPLVIIVGRHIYGFKVPITIFSGISKMKYWIFLLSVLITDSVWIPFYLSIGRRLGPKTLKLLHEYHFNHWYYLLILVPIILALFPFFLLRKGKQKKSD
jgi:membrane protein DedA with SNARE-associated domain